MFGGALESAAGLEQGLQDFNGLQEIQMVITLNVAIIVFTLLYVAWVANRIKLDKMQAKLNKMRMHLLANE